MAKKKSKPWSRETIYSERDRLLKGGLKPDDDDRLQRLMSELRALGSEDEK